jgi:hypothetical protein
MDWLLSHIESEWSVIKDAPLILAFTWTIGLILIWWVLDKHVYHRRLAAKDDLIKTYKEKLGLLQDSKSTLFAEKSDKLPGSPPPNISYKPKPNIIFSHCKKDAMFIDEDISAGIWVAEFINEVSSKRDESRGVVAHLEYLAEGSSIWKTNQGLWLRGKSSDFDFSMNEPGCVVLAAIIKEDFTKPNTICAVGYRQADELHPFNMDAYDIENKLPVIVKVRLLGNGIDMGFRFRIEKGDDGYRCSFIM